MQKRKTIAFDIDGTICDTKGSDYQNSTPWFHRIKQINDLYDSGVNVVYFTARGSGSGKDQYQFTLDQLVGWGCKFSKLIVGKPAVDLFVDDKAVSAKDFFNGQE